MLVLRSTVLLFHFHSLNLKTRYRLQVPVESQIVSYWKRASVRERCGTIAAFWEEKRAKESDNGDEKGNKKYLSLHVNSWLKG